MERIAPRWRASLCEPAQLQSINWQAGLALRAYGLRIGVRVNDAAMFERLLPELPPLWQPSRSANVDRMFSVIVRDGARLRSNVRHELYADAERIAELVTRRSLVELFENQAQMYVAEFAPRRVFIHAGVVGWRGSAIVIPGSSLSGKTSLVAALIAAGATYYSDEYAVLDERGRVHPYPRRLSFRGSTGSRNRRRASEDLGAATGARPLPIGDVLVTEYREGARFRTRPLSVGAAALALLRHTVSVRRQPETALATLRRALAGARAIEGIRGEAAEVVGALLRQ